MRFRPVDQLRDLCKEESEGEAGGGVGASSYAENLRVRCGVAQSTMRAARRVAKSCGGVAHLVEAELLGPLAEDKEHGVDDVGLATTIGANHGRKPLPPPALQVSPRDPGQSSQRARGLAHDHAAAPANARPGLAWFNPLP